MKRSICNLLIIISVFLVFFSGCEEAENAPDMYDPNPGSFGSPNIRIIHDTFESEHLVVAGSPGLNFIVSFENKLVDEAWLEFTPLQNQLPVIMMDNRGTKWDVFGNAIEGPGQGEILNSTVSFMGYWFSFGTFFPGADIYEEEPIFVNSEISYDETNDWLIDIKQIYAGTLGLDVIPALEDPERIEYKERNFLQNEFYVKDHELVIGIWINNLTVAYPHSILDWHEIINDKIGSTSYALSYCPLTGTGICWNRNVNGSETTFGVSGLLYNSNLIPFDRTTKSFWSQILSFCVKGELKSTLADKIKVVETKWETWKKMYPETLVITDNTGYDRNYNEYPYFDYRTNNDFLAYPVSYDDGRLNRKERVHGIIINGKAKVYRFLHFN